ncbi:ribonuclease H-like domain-containing protein [Xylaria sp. CBS 124048]|nr:ribonuclease H-like domain-containing protein [Xylaria sp. CBS 124048]
MTGHRNGVMEPPSQRESTQSSEGDTDIDMAMPHSHFAPHYWRDNGISGTALQEKPNHGYQWASPALSEPIRMMLDLELVNKDRLASAGYPPVPPLYRFARAIKISDSKSVRPLPPVHPDSTSRKYAALVIDCEMVELENNVSDLVRISVVDFMTGSVVLDSLVQPMGIVRQWRTRVSGVDAAMLNAAKANPNVTVLRGWPEARELIFKVADEHTILIGHALSNDLKILRIAAQRVVDSLILTAQAAFGLSTKRFPRLWSLKTACKALMNIEIQRSCMAHDPLEDALATRELVLWCLTHSTALLAWAYDERTEYEQVSAARRSKPFEATRTRAAEAEARRMAERTVGEEPGESEEAKISLEVPAQRRGRGRASGARAGAKQAPAGRGRTWWRHQRGRVVQNEL